MSASAASLKLLEHDPKALDLDLEALQGFLRETGPLAVVDLETTGLTDDSRAEIIEIGAVLLDPDRSHVATIERTIKPRGALPEAIRVLTGIQPEDLQGAPAIADVARPLHDLFAGRTLIAHNIAFERHFLSRYVAPELARERYLDTQQLLALAHPDAPDLRLETFSRMLLGREERHRALADALDAAQLLSKLARGARDGDARYVITSSALERYGGSSPWKSLLETPALATANSEASQYIRIAPTKEKRVPFDSDAIAKALGDEARGRRHFPGYRVRDEQIQMAQEFARVLDSGGRLMLEGGTGVGKSLAYLAAAIPFSVERADGGIREPILLSTRTKLLQDQLLAKDIPAAAAMLGYPELRALSIKGRANYVCQRRCDQVLVEGREPTLFEEDRLAYASLATCARLRAHGEVGTLPGALFQLFPPLRDLRRRAVAARAEHCSREECASERECPFGKRRSALARAHLVVANHDLLLRWPADYPSFTHAIVDEAHELGGVADEVYAQEVRPEAILERIDEVFGTSSAGRRGAAPRLPVDAAAAQAWRGDVQQELSALGDLVGTRAGDFGAYELPPHADRILPDAARLCTTLAQRLEAIAAEAASLDDKRDVEEEDETSDLVGRVVGDLRSASALLRAAFDAEQGEMVASFEDLSPPYDRWRLALRPVSPAPVFHDAFMAKLESFSCVSASLFVGEDPFAALGTLEVDSRAEQETWRFSVASPFPYREHMRVLALSEDGDAVEMTAAAIEAVSTVLGGRTLGLFTSLKRMRDVRDRLFDPLRDQGLDVLVPRRSTDDPAALVERFRRSEGRAVLLGARTFWQGLDIPGDALQAVVIEKLPFEVPTELRRRREGRLRDQGDDAFERYTLGVMLLNLKQMIGRLIRSELDRGVVLIADPRAGRRYAGRLDAALPPGCSVQTVTLAELPDALAEVGVGTDAG